MRGGNRLFGSETVLVYSLLSPSGFLETSKSLNAHTYTLSAPHKRTGLNTLVVQIDALKLLSERECVWGKVKVAQLLFFFLLLLSVSSHAFSVPLLFSRAPLLSQAEL